MNGIAERVRAACIEAALAAYEEAGILGLCHEGRWEYAIQAMRRLRLETVAQEEPESGRESAQP
ncbi:MAG: hypothetical protein WCZ87_09600 [Thiohalobacteraceae bacterium]